ncbi:pre-mRNA-splicing regulator female-lethal(2)D [Daktulosphaira vitifoliae]|uniref:pre-mRNA-splicing regulator female-lethal(2)D n=1 Tax=Daktulosphaira vitifoliae TaxID=58002 RepID=UPI0021AAE576|nr:pre-mRNA-splicing regulator female-lethal(2)D [Daktulosphaira vitifoliae]
MVEECRTGFGQMDNIDDDNMVRLPRQRIVDMYKNAMSRVRVLEAKANEATICSRCSNRCDKKEQNDQAFRELVLREKVLLRKLAIKEQEIQDYSTQLSALKNSIQSKSLSSLKCPLQDPAVNVLIQKLRQDLSATKTRLDETQNELNAWKFTPDSNTGKRLMAKCRLLYQENEELGKMVNSGRIAKLEGELALQKNFSEEVKKSQSELDEFLQDLDEDVEGMQSTIYFLQNELKKIKGYKQNSNNTGEKESDQKTEINGINKDSTDIKTKSDIEISQPSPVVETNVEHKSNKHEHKLKKSKSENTSSTSSNMTKIKKHKSATLERVDLSSKDLKLHKNKNKVAEVSDILKSVKSEKRHSSKDKAHKRPKLVIENTNITELKSPTKSTTTTVNVLLNGS